MFDMFTLSSTSSSDEDCDYKTCNGEKILSIHVLGVHHKIAERPDTVTTDRPLYIDIILDIVQYENTYELFCRVPTLKLSCGFYDTLEKANKALRKAMKIAMKGKFIHQQCWRCGDKEIWFPDIECEKCGEFILKGSWETVDI